MTLHLTSTMTNSASYESSLTSLDEMSTTTAATTGLDSLSLLEEDESLSSSSLKRKNIESVESLPNIPKPAKSQQPPIRRNTDSKLATAASITLASRAINKNDRFSYIRHSDTATTSRHRFEKAPTLTCSSSEERDDDHLNQPYCSTNSLPISTPSLYVQSKNSLENDPNMQREIALGKRIGFYRLGKELGSGNFSKVKLGIHSLTKEKVAVKIMDKTKMDDKASRLLTREVDNMEYLHHPNVIRLFEVIETLSKVYLVMEYAGCGELYTYVHENGKLTEEQAKPIFAQLVSAVAHLHTKNIVHRDIKAENVIFSQPGWVKLADFGFSCQYEVDTRLTTFCGSPPYAAPELFKDPNYEGLKVDMWALGVLLYFMLVGVTPFRGETVSILKTNIMSGAFHMPDYLSSFAQHVIQRLLWMDPYQRATTNELKKMYWLSTSKFPDSYLQISMHPSEDNLKTDKTEQEVWGRLLAIGIDEDMIRASADKGAKDAIIGTYRIIQYQCQAPEHEKERNKIRDHVQKLAEKNRKFEEQMNKNSKTCTII